MPGFGPTPQLRFPLSLVLRGICTPRGPSGEALGLRGPWPLLHAGGGRERRLKWGADSVGAVSSQEAHGEPGQRQVPMAPTGSVNS